MLDSPNHTFKKGERLRKKREIQALFQSEELFICYPFRVLYCKQKEKNNESPIQVLISVPKRRQKLAVRRNLLKRRTREAYRLQKSDLLNHLKDADFSLSLGIVYVGEKISSYCEIYDSLSGIVQELKSRL